MKVCLIVLAFLFSSFLLSAQGLIAVQNGGAVSFHSQLDSALYYAQNGDTIYLPGGNFSVPQEINKEVHIVGVGYHPDSTSVTGATIISGVFALGTSSTNGSVTGIFFSTPTLYGGGQIRFIANVSNYSISRCYIQGGISNTNGFANNIIIKENIIGRYFYSFGFSGEASISFSSSSSNIGLFNNIIIGGTFLSQSIIRNNIFLHYNPNILQQYGLYANNCVIENNVFANSNGSSNSIFRNNVNCPIDGVSGTNQGINNFCCESLQNIYPSYGSGNIFSNNFHLPDSSPFKNAGTDGTDIGIYGGASPWKDGGIPFNPRILFKNIATTTDQNGNLQINIKVEAQKN